VKTIRDASEADEVTQHYLIVLERIRAAVTANGNLREADATGPRPVCRFVQRQCEADPAVRRPRQKPSGSTWKACAYVDATLEVYRRALAKFPRTGICLQAYLFRTKKDLEALLPAEAVGPPGKGRVQRAAERCISNEERRRRKLLFARRVPCFAHNGTAPCSALRSYARHGNDQAFGGFLCE